MLWRPVQFFVVAVLVYFFLSIGNRINQSDIELVLGTGGEMC